MKKYSIKLIALLLALALALPISSCGRPKEFEITVLSQNLRVDTGKDGEENDIFYRGDRFIRLLEEYQPDLIGMQEFTPSWDAALYEYLAENNYGLALKYRSYDSFEGTPIAYNMDRLELLEENYFWLSDTPEVESPSWDDGSGKRCRIATECVFKEKETGIKFVHINTHYGLTVTAEEESSLLLHRLIEEKYSDMPVFLTGDFNMREGSLGYSYLVEDDLVMNSQYLAEELGTVCGTSNGFKERESLSEYTSVIDFVFVTKQIAPTYYSVLTDKPDGKFVSDHFGVLTKHIVSK